MPEVPPPELVPPKLVPPPEPVLPEPAPPPGARLGEPLRLSAKAPLGSPPSPRPALSVTSHPYPPGPTLARSCPLLGTWQKATKSW